KRLQCRREYKISGAEHETLVATRWTVSTAPQCLFRELARSRGLPVAERDQLGGATSSQDQQQQLLRQRLLKHFNRQGLYGETQSHQTVQIGLALKIIFTGRCPDSTRIRALKCRRSFGLELMSCSTSIISWSGSRPLQAGPSRVILASTTITPVAGCPSPLKLLPLSFWEKCCGRRSGTMQAQLLPALLIIHPAVIILGHGSGTRAEQSLNEIVSLVVMRRPGRQTMTGGGRGKRSAKLTSPRENTKNLANDLGGSSCDSAAAAFRAAARHRGSCLHSIAATRDTTDSNARTALMLPCGRAGQAMGGWRGGCWTKELSSPATDGLRPTHAQKYTACATQNVHRTGRAARTTPEPHPDCLKIIESRRSGRPSVSKSEHAKRKSYEQRFEEDESKIDRFRHSSKTEKEPLPEGANRGGTAEALSLTGQAKRYSRDRLQIESLTAAMMKLLVWAAGSVRRGANKIFRERSEAADEEISRPPYPESCYCCDDKEFCRNDATGAFASRRSSECRRRLGGTESTRDCEQSATERSPSGPAAASRSCATDDVEDIVEIGDAEDERPMTIRWRREFRRQRRRQPRSVGNAALQGGVHTEQVTAAKADDEGVRLDESALCRPAAKGPERVKAQPRRLQSMSAAPEDESDWDNSMTEAPSIAAAAAVPQASNSKRTPATVNLWQSRPTPLARDR
uniref:UDENN domain-containing protein n=1 Tax=Macrostomum lignano TaxID=282301 RepID=A0A1I8FP15_9PLAT